MGKHLNYLSFVKHHFLFQALPPTGSVVSAGHIPPKEIVAVVRPASFNSASASKNLDQKYILILKKN